jgi:hypothetical protein
MTCQINYHDDDHSQTDRAAATTSKIHGLKCPIDPRLNDSNISLVYSGKNTAFTLLL